MTEENAMLISLLFYAFIAAWVLKLIFGAVRATWKDQPRPIIEYPIHEAKLKRAHALAWLDTELIYGERSTPVPPEEYKATLAARQAHFYARLTGAPNG